MRQNTSASIEVIIGVDLGDDNTAKLATDLAAKYPDQVQAVVHHKKLPCGSDNYLDLIRRARGEFIAHLDGDDYWHPDKLELQLSFLLANPSCSCCYTNAQVLGENDKALGVFTTPHPPIFDLKYLVRRGNFLNHSSLLYKAEYKQDILALGSPLVDFQIAAVLASKGNISFINQDLVGYRYFAPSSIRASHNDLVRELCWKALESTGRNQLDTVSRLESRAEFLRQVFFRSLKLKSADLMKKWWSIVSAQENSLALFLFLSIAIVRRLAIELVGSAQSLGFLRGEKVFYRR